MMTALQTSVKLLAKKDYSSNKIRIALKKKNFTEQEIENAIETLEQKNYLNDHRYALDRASVLIQKYYGDSYIFHKLDAENLSITQQDLNSLRGEYKINEIDSLKVTIETKTKNYTNEERLSNLPKVIKYLTARGFPPQLIMDELGVDDVSWS